MDIKEIAEEVSKRIYVEDGLLKEVGEPVGYLHQWIEYHPYGDTVAGEPCSAITNDGKPFDKSDTVTLLFTSDQVAAAIAKATKPLEDQLAKAEQLWQIAQGRCDGLEEKLAKAEQRVAEWQPIDTAPKDGTRVLLCIDHGEWGDKVWTGVWGDGWMVSYGKARTEPTHWMPLPKSPNGASS